ncbi:MAG: endonuclease [Chloroflexota bacterium]|jgi:endonuclease-8|nr:endonuclease [Chloroflexota bacterium]
MPEGDTIWRAAAALCNRVGGKVVREARPGALARLAGRRLTAVEPTGKHLLMRFEGRLVLHTHMRMRGSWHLYSPGQRWRLPANQARAVLRFDDSVAVLFNAQVIELLPDLTPQAPAATGLLPHLGPDILADDFDVDAVVTRVREAEARPGAPLAIGDALLDQRVCAGIGNIYKCESLWLRRLDPWTPTVHLDDPALAEVYAAARRLMKAALPGFGGPRQQRAVHARGGRPCPRCGTPVRVRAQGPHARLTYHCPGCQG